MTFDKMLRTYRKQLGLSQEKMAETLNVSRQAITKWESGIGMPDISNLMAISELFQVSIDDLLSSEKEAKLHKEFLYESCVDYDIDRQKKFDMVLGGSHRVILTAKKGEKIKIRLASNTIKHLAEGLKIKLDDIKDKIDVQLNRFGDITEAITKEDLTIFIDLPERYLGDTELLVHCQKLELINICSENFELDGRVSQVMIHGGKGEMELNSKLDMTVKVTAHQGEISVNQLSATSRLYLPADYSFRARKKGIGTTLSFEKDGIKTDDFSIQDADNSIEVSGFKNELVIIKNSN